MCGFEKHDKTVQNIAFLAEGSPAPRLFPILNESESFVSFDLQFIVNFILLNIN